MGKLKYVVSLACLLFLQGQPVAGESVNTIESAFESFFNEPYQQTLGHREVRLVVKKDEAVSFAVPVTLEFDIDKVEKVLLLKLPATGYSDSGYLDEKCRDEPVFLAAYKLDPNKKINGIQNWVHTNCNNQFMTLLLWVRTADGKYYSTSTTFRILFESPG